MKNIFWIFPILTVFVFAFDLGAQIKDDYTLNIVYIGAHPDDADIKAGGTAYKWIQRGHNVVMISLTNGNAGHHELSKVEIERTRREEARRSAEVIGAKYIILNTNDEELMPTLEARWEIIKIIREYKADIVITHRPWDYHPDHRYTGQLVLDASYLVIVPTVLPNIPRLEKLPVYLYSSDRFTQPVPFMPDVCVDIDDAIEKKFDMLHQHKSQFYGWLPFLNGITDQVPEKDSDRRAWLAETRKADLSFSADFYRDKLIELYGKQKGEKIKNAECFQDSEYGTKITKSNLKYYFPFFD